VRVTYGDRESALALFGGWTSIDLSKYSNDEDFRFINLLVVQSFINSWSETVPGFGDLKWTKSRIAGMCPIPNDFPPDYI
jgi:hypothetical protein